MIEDENSTTISSINPTFITIKLIIFSSSLFQIQMPKLKNNTHCVYAIGFKRTTMLEYIYNGHSIAYDPILPE